MATGPPDQGQRPRAARLHHEPPEPQSRLLRRRGVAMNEGKTRCEVCETTERLFCCALDDQPMLWFCAPHFAVHKLTAHHQSARIPPKAMACGCPYTAGFTP